MQNKKPKEEEERKKPRVLLQPWTQFYQPKTRRS